jgi:hypothetical protein
MALRLLGSLDAVPVGLFTEQSPRTTFQRNVTHPYNRIFRVLCTAIRDNLRGLRKFWKAHRGGAEDAE